MNASRRYDELLPTLGLDPGRFRQYVTRLFDGVSLGGRRLLDVGGGSGVLSFFAALQGAEVTCLEPAGPGSDAARLPAFTRFADALSASTTVTLDRRTLQEVDVGTLEPYDVVVVHNAINHLDEPACRVLHRDVAARRAYSLIFDRLAALTAPAGDLLIADCARRNAWGALRIHNPMAPDIDWTVHQQPSTWAALAQEAGFAHVATRWNAPTRIPPPVRRLMDNALGAYVTTSHFTVAMRRR